MRKDVVMIDGRRDCYEPYQLGKTMTVGELIDYLSYNYDRESPVMIINDGGYTYGQISEDSIFEKNVEMDEEN